MPEQTKLQSLSCKKQRMTSSYRQYVNSSSPTGARELSPLPKGVGGCSDGRGGVLSIDGLSKGAGSPIGNALRRALLSQLEGAAVTAVGLGKIYKPILALQIPGLFYDWKTLDKARKVMMPDFKKGVKKAGFYLAGFGDVGLYYLMSVNKPIKKPSDMKTLKPYRLTGDGIIPVVAQTIGFTARPLSIPEILPALTSGRIDVCLAPPLAAEQLQWAPQLNYLLDHAIGTGIGALVFSQKTLNRLSPEHRKILKKTGRKAAKMLTKRIRKEDKKALKRIRKKMTVTKLNRAQFKVWDKIFAKARKRLAQGTFDPKLVKKLEKLAGK